MENSAIDTAQATATALRFNIDPNALQSAVKLLSAKLIERRPNAALLDHLHIEARPDGTVIITGTDCETWASVTLEAQSVDSPGSLITPAHALASALMKVKKGRDSVTLDQSAPHLILKAGRSRLALKSVLPDEFPLTPIAKISGTLSGELDAGQFFGDLRAVSPCIETKGFRYYLKGAALQVRELAGRSRLVTVASNGSNIAAASRAIPQGLESLPDCILPAKAVALAIAAGTYAKADSVQLGHDAGAFDQSGALIIESGPVRIVSKLGLGDFPANWQDVIANNCTPSEGISDCLFPELLPGTPSGAMEKIAKGAKLAIDWQAGEGAQIGTVADDANLIFVSMNVVAGGPVKGYEYAWGAAKDRAQEYLADLAAKRGLPSYDDIAARCEAVEIGTAYASTHLATDGERVLGLTVSGSHYIPSWTETVQDWETLSERTIHHDEYQQAVEGSYSILMPSSGPATLEADVSVNVEGDRSYPVATNSSNTKIHLTKEQVAALCGDDLWQVIAVPTAGGVRYVSKWLFDDGASRLLCVKKNGRCPDKGAVREYLTREQVEAALAGEAIEARPDAEGLAELQAMADGEGAAAGLARHIIAVASENSASEGESAPEAPKAPEAPEMPQDAPQDAPQAQAEAYGPPAPQSDAPDIAARLAAIEAKLDALSREYEASKPAPPSEGIADQPRTKRTPAHERAIRRAWAERKARRVAEAHMRLGRAQFDRIWAQYENASRSRNTWKAEAENALSRERAALTKRRRAAKRALQLRSDKRNLRNQRDTMCKTVQSKDQAIAVMRADLARVRADMANPETPERSSDIARLVRERDEARNALPALKQRCERMQAALEQGADQIEALALDNARLRRERNAVAA